MMRLIPVYFLKLILKLFGILFNRTDEINNKLNELTQMKKEGRIILEEDFDFKIFDNISQNTGSSPTKEHFLFVKEKADKIFKKTGYYPSKKQMDFFISEYKEAP